MSTDVSLEDNGAILNAIQDVRKDDTSTDWVLIGHKNDDPNLLSLVATGDDGFDGLKKLLNEEKETVGFAKKGRFSVVHGAVVKYFQPYHVDFDNISSITEISNVIIKDKVEKAAGNADFVRDVDFAIGKPEFGKNQNQKQANQSALKKTGSSSNPSSINNLCKNYKSEDTLGKPIAATQSQIINLSNEMLNSLNEIRDLKYQITWTAGTYEDGNKYYLELGNIHKPIVFLGKGSGGSDKFKGHLFEDKFAYVLIRVVDLVDGHKTTKFLFLHWIGNGVPMIQKVKVSTYKGGLSEKFAPFHVDLTISDLREISDQTIKEKVSAISMSSRQNIT